MCVWVESRCIYFLCCTSVHVEFFLFVDVEGGEDTRIVDRVLQYLRYVGDVLGSDIAWVGVFFQTGG